MKALPINTIMGKVQTMPAAARTKTSFFATTYACVRCAKDRRATQKTKQLMRREGVALVQSTTTTSLGRRLAGWSRVRMLCH